MVFIFLSRSDKFVVKHPGSMMWTVTPKCIISRRNPSQNASTPYLDMAYDTAPGTLTIPNALATLTIRPLVCLRRGRNALVTDIVPQRLTSTTFFMSSMVVHSTKPGMKIPALFTIAHKPEDEVILIIAKMSGKLYDNVIYWDEQHPGGFKNLYFLVLTVNTLE